MKLLNIIDNDVAYTLWIGTSAIDNWRIIECSDKDDMWFHVEGVPSCHVILKNGGQYSAAMLQMSASLCRENTVKLRGKRCPPIIATEVGNIRLGKTAGMVHILNQSMVQRFRVK